MDFIKFILSFIIVFCIGFSISYLFKNKLIMEEGFIIGSISVFILWLIFDNNNRKNTFIKKHKSILNIITLIFILIGAFIWFIGEYLVYSGKPEHILLDPIGAFICSIGSIITLIIYLYG